MSGFDPGAFGVIIVAALFYLVPTFVAYRRKHHYRHVILALNVIGGITGLGWAVAFVWAVWPSDKSLVDPVLGNVTGKGYRNAGDTVGAAAYGQSRGYDEEREAYARLRGQGLTDRDPRVL